MEMQKVNKLYQRILQPTLILIWGVVVFWFLQTQYAYHFFYEEQNQLFLLTWDYVVSYLSKPAWLASLLGDFFTQFYYYLYAGATILTLSFLVVGDFARRSFEKAGLKWASFPLAVALMTLELFCAFLAEHRLETVIALVGGLFLYLLLPSRKYRNFWMLAISLIAYWLFGYGVWIFLILCLIDSFCIQQPIQVKQVLTPIGMALLLLLVIAASKHIYQQDFTKLAIAPGVNAPTLPEYKIEKILEVENEYYFGHDDKVIKIVESTPREERLEQQTYYYYLASARQGKLADNLLKVYPGDLGVFRRIGPKTPTIVMKGINELYFLMGDMTFAERAAMLSHVTSRDNRNVRMIKRLAEVNYVKGDTAATMKYLRILNHTFAYRSWAEMMMKPDRSKLTHHLTEKRLYTNKQDTLRGSDNAHYIMDELLESNPDNEVVLHYMLCSDLLLKDMETFKADYDRWCMNRNKPRKEPLYQQALMIYLAGTNANNEEWEKYINNRQIFEQFQEYSRQRGNEAYRNTYWFYFDCGIAPKMINDQ